MVPLEEIFDSNDVAKKPKVTPNNVEVEDHNIRHGAGSKYY